MYVYIIFLVLNVSDCYNADELDNQPSSSDAYQDSDEISDFGK